MVRRSDAELYRRARLVAVAIPTVVALLLLAVGRPILGVVATVWAVAIWLWSGTPWYRASFERTQQRRRESSR